MMVALASWLDEIQLWTTDYVPDATPLQHAAKVCEEAGELIACEIADGRSSGGDASREAADVLIAALAYCAKTELDPDEILKHRMRELWLRV